MPPPGPLQPQHWEGDPPLLNLTQRMAHRYPQTLCRLARRHDGKGPSSGLSHSVWFTLELDLDRLEVALVAVVKLELKPCCQAGAQAVYQNPSLLFCFSPRRYLQHHSD